MSQHEQLAIFRAAYDFVVHIETIVHGFSRYHKYSIGAELRQASRTILRSIVRANYARKERCALLLELRYTLEDCKVLIRLAHDSKAFRSTNQYLHCAEQLVAIMKQNEGWLKHSQKITI